MPPQARARAVAAVCLSAQPPADRSVQRLKQRRRWTTPAACKAARRCSGLSSARQRARTVAVPCLTSLFPRGPHVLVPAACSRPCLALPWHRRRRCRARALTPPVPAITRGLPASTEDGTADPVAVHPHTPGGSRFRLAPGHEPGLQRACCARSSQAPPALEAPTQGLASLLVVRCSVTAPPLGVCGPASLWTSVAGTVRAARARSRLVELARADAYPGG